MENKPPKPNSKKPGKFQSSREIGKININFDSSAKKRKSSFDEKGKSPGSKSPNSPPFKTFSSVPGANDNKKRIKLINNDLKLAETDINLDILKKEFENYPEGSSSLKGLQTIKSFGYNSYYGTIKENNEDRLVVVPQIKKPPSNPMKTWPKMSYFAIFDGHGGDSCSNFLEKNLLNYIISNENFPFDIKTSLLEAFEKAEDEFYLLNVWKSIDEIDHSGSCALVVLIVENTVYVANTGDSRAIMSVSEGTKIKPLSEDHKPNNKKEFERVINNGGKIYLDGEDIQQTFINDLATLENYKDIEFTLREYPSGLAVLRTIGDIQAKKEDYGGKPGCIISTPEIFICDLNKEDDFIVMGCDGIFDMLTNNEIINAVWYIFKHTGKNKNYNLHELTKDSCNMIIKYGMDKLAYDNMSCIVIGFEGLEKFLQNKIYKDRVHSAMSDSKKNKVDKKG